MPSSATIFQSIQDSAPSPCTMVIFGASGDLTKRKLIPSLFNLFRKGQLPEHFTVLGFSRSIEDKSSYREAMHRGLQQFGHKEFYSEGIWQRFSQKLCYISADFNDPSCYDQLENELKKIEQERGTEGNRLFYLAVPPSAYCTITDRLGEQGLNKPVSESSWTRIIVEKPFGRDLESAKSLNREIGKYFTGSQIYRIDHYLGKETVQNLMVLRFANTILEPIWNRNYIDNVQITAAETVGIEGRAGYYEQAGALRDMIQSHLLQVLAHIAMEPPVSFEADSVRNEVVQVFQSIQPMNPDLVASSTVRAQYEQGVVDGQKVIGYKQEPNVKPDSTTETFAALRLFIDNWRWAGVPFYLRTGKRLPKRVTEVRLVFRHIPHVIFRMMGREDLQSNILVIRIQPNEGISLKFSAKLPGSGTQIRPVSMDFFYKDAFLMELSEAYERLLIDCMLGDPTLFARCDAVEESWAIITPILEAWKNQEVKELPTYPAGSWGPDEATKLIEHDLREWKNPG